MSEVPAFSADHRGDYLADTQFDYPGGGRGWQYDALDADNGFTRLEPPAAHAASATPLAYLGCDDPDLRVGRDLVHPGYKRRPCLQWHAPAAATYRLEGEVSLLQATASGQFNVRVIFDDVELLSRTFSFPEMLDFQIEAPVREGGFLRVLFTSMHIINHNDALFYLRVRRAATPCEAGSSRIACRAEAAPAWARLGTVIGADDVLPATEIARLAQGLYGSPKTIDPGLAELARQQARRAFAPQLARYRQARFFSAAPRTPTDQGG